MLLAFARVHKASKAFHRVIPTGEPALAAALLWKKLNKGNGCKEPYTAPGKR